MCKLLAARYSQLCACVHTITTPLACLDCSLHFQLCTWTHNAGISCMVGIISKPETLSAQKSSLITPSTFNIGCQTQTRPVTLGMLLVVCRSLSSHSTSISSSPTLTAMHQASLTLRSSKLCWHEWDLQHGVHGLWCERHLAIGVDAIAHGPTPYLLPSWQMPDARPPSRIIMCAMPPTGAYANSHNYHGFLVNSDRGARNVDKIWVLQYISMQCRQGSSHHNIVPW